MATDKRIGRAGVIALIITAVVVAQLLLLLELLREATTPITPPPIMVREIAAGKTAVPGQVVRDANATQAVPPLRPTHDPLYTTGSRYPLIRLCNLVYLDTMWPSAGVENIVWDAIDQCIADARSLTVTLAIGQVVSQSVGLIWPPQFIAGGGGDGSSGSPWQTDYVPGWAGGTSVFTTSAGYYNAIEYDDATFLGYLVDGAVAAGARYSETAEIAFIRINPGFEEENQPGDDRADEADFLSRHEAAVASCAAYKSFVQTLSEAVQTAFPNHEVILPSGTVACDGTTSEGYRQEQFSAWATAAVRIGASIHSLVGDRADADEADGNVREDWRLLSTGRKMTEWGLPMLFEFGEDPDVGYVHEYGDDPWLYGYWATVAGAGAGGDWIARNYNWNDYRTRAEWEIADYWLGRDDRLGIVFADRLYPTYNYSAGYGASGWKSNYETHGTQLDPTAQPQVCSQAVGLTGANLRATAIARATAAYTGTTPIAPVPCAYATPLPTPKATLQATPGTGAAADLNMAQRLRNYQGRVISPGDMIEIAAETDWTYYGDTRVLTMTLWYLDIGMDALRLHLPTGEGVGLTHDVALGNSQIWVSTTWTYASGYISNTLGGAFVRVENLSGTAGLFVGELYVDVGAESVTPTATPTATITPTPSVTPTPSQTPTPSVTPTSTPSPTPSPTGTLAPTNTPLPTATFTPWPAGVFVCPTRAATIDGSLAEWAGFGATPVAVEPATAAYIWPAATPSAADLSGTFWCSHTGSALQIAGIITDSVRYVDSAPGDDDAAEIGIDGWGDGTLRVRVDDHDLVVAADGRVRDYEVYPVSASSAVSQTASGWQFELSLPASVLDRVSLTGRLIRLVFGLRDDDDGGQLDQVMLAPARAAGLP